MTQNNVEKTKAYAGSPNVDQDTLKHGSARSLATWALTGIVMVLEAHTRTRRLGPAHADPSHTCPRHGPNPRGFSDGRLGGMRRVCRLREGRIPRSQGSDRLGLARSSG